MTMKSRQAGEKLPEGKSLPSSDGGEFVDLFLAQEAAFAQINILLEKGPDLNDVNTVISVKMRGGSGNSVDTEFAEDDGRGVRFKFFGGITVI